MNSINLSRYQLEVRLFLSKRKAKDTRAKARVIILLRVHRAACTWVIATCNPVWPIFPCFTVYAYPKCINFIKQETWSALF